MEGGVLNVNGKRMKEPNKLNAEAVCQAWLKRSFSVRYINGRLKVRIRITDTYKISSQFDERAVHFKPSPPAPLSHAGGGEPRSVPLLLI